MNTISRALRTHGRVLQSSSVVRLGSIRSLHCFQPSRARPQTQRPLSRQIRYESSSNRPLTDRPDTAPELATEKKEVPSYDLTFTCKKCSERSTHRISKQGYHHGTILITCQGCKNRHLVSDHLKIFSDKGITIEDILREKGQMLKKGSLTPGEEGDIEFWDDGTQTTRAPKA